MRKVKVFFIALLAGLFISATALASATDLSPKNNLRSEIIKLIDHPSQDILKGKDLVANLRLMVNDDNQLIVLDTGTSEPELDRYIKSKLNYREVNAQDVIYFKFYFLKMEFKS